MILQPSSLALGAAPPSPTEQLLTAGATATLCPALSWHGLLRRPLPRGSQELFRQHSPPARSASGSGEPSPSKTGGSPGCGAAALQSRLALLLRCPMLHLAGCLPAGELSLAVCYNPHTAREVPWLGAPSWCTP